MENDVKKVPKRKINEVLTATTNNLFVEDAKEAISNRSLLYNCDEEALFIKYRDDLIKLGMLPDDDNIVSRLKKGQVPPADVDRIALNEFIHVNGLKVEDDLSDLPMDNWYAHKIFCKEKSIEQLDEKEELRKNIIVLSAKNEVLELISEKDLNSLPSNEYFAGEIILGASDFSSVSHYNITLTSNALNVTPSIIGSTSLPHKAGIVRKQDNNNNIFGIYFSDLQKDVSYYAFFTGWYKHATRFPDTDQYDRKQWFFIDSDDGSGGGGGEGGTTIKYSSGDIFEVLASSEIEARNMLPLSESDIKITDPRNIPNFDNRILKGILKDGHNWNLIKIDYRVGDLITIDNIEDSLIKDRLNPKEKN